MFETGDIVQYNGPRRLLPASKGVKPLDRGQIGTIDRKHFARGVWRGEWEIYFDGFSEKVLVPESDLLLVSSKIGDDTDKDFLFLIDEDDLSKEDLLRQEFNIDEDFAHTIRRKRKFDDEVNRRDG